MTKRIDIEKLTMYEGPEESPGYLLWRVSTQWRSEIENVLKPLELTHPQFVMLATIAWLTRKGEKITQADVGRAAGFDPNTTSQVLRGLEKRKLIKRVRSLDDRSKNPKLTELGSKKLAKALPAVEQADIRFFSVLNDKKLDTLVAAFQKLVSLK